MALKKNVSRVIGFIGALFALSGLFVYLIWGEPVWLYTTLELIAILHLSVFFISHYEILKEVSRRRSTKFGTNSFMMILLFAAILGIINFILVRHEIRVDLSDSKTFSLTPQTRNILQNLQGDVKVTGFFSTTSKVREKAEDLIQNYTYESEQVSYLMVDPDKKPAVAKQYGITGYDTVVLESGGQSAMVRTLTEDGMTSALIRVSRGTKKTFYFVEGHGERDISDTEKDGYSFLRENLEKQSFDVKRLSLLREKQVPEEADVVIVAGPKRPFTTAELVKLKNYLEQGGQLFLLLDPMLDAAVEESFKNFVAQWGIQLDQGLILDPTSDLGVAIPIINPDAYLPHDITKEFNLATFYALSRRISFSPAQGTGYRFEPFLETSAKSWLTLEVEGDLSIDPTRDQKGPIQFGAVITPEGPVTFPGLPEETRSDKSSKMRLVIVGDSDFGSNGVARAGGNGDLFLNVVSWLAGEEDLISIRPQDVPTTTLVLTTEQTNVIFTVSVLIIPLGVMGIGLFVWRGRRQL